MSATDPFGARRPSPFQSRVRAIAGRLPDTYFGRRTASALLGLAGGRSGAAFDVEIFGGARARLHPYDNICEKRVYLTPQFWEPAERQTLARAIAEHAARDFFFVDVGANVGLYTLFARAEAARRGLSFRALCIEPDPEMRRRLAFNLAASEAAQDAAVAPFAVAARAGRLRFAVNATSRGMSRIAADGASEVDARPLLELIVESGMPRIDVMKVDIEGGEHDALAPFFASAPPALAPAMIILEISHENDGRSAAEVVRGAGYRTVLRTRLNEILRRDP